MNVSEVKKKISPVYFMNFISVFKSSSLNLFFFVIVSEHEGGVDKDSRRLSEEVGLS